MRVLIVEDNFFNAYCLQQLLENIFKEIKISIVSKSTDAISAVQSDKPACVILDGFLNSSDGLDCNGPVLADMLWQRDPALVIIAWTDSIVMRNAFKSVFKQHNKPFSGSFIWPKVVSEARIISSFAYFNTHHTGLSKIHADNANYVKIFE
jgi:CheY-like chemotaxis protein